MARLTLPIFCLGLLFAAPAVQAQATITPPPAGSDSTGATPQTDWTGAKKQPQIANPDPQTGKLKDGPQSDPTAGPPVDKPGAAGSELSEVLDPENKKK